MTDAEQAAEEYAKNKVDEFNKGPFPNIINLGVDCFLAGHAFALTPRKNQYWLILFQSHERAGAYPHWLVDTEDYAKEICKNNNGNLSTTASFTPWTYIPIELLPPTPQEG